MGSIYDPTFGSQGAVLERFYSAIAALLFFQTDAHHMVIQALVQMFNVVPLGAFTLERIKPDVLATIMIGSFILAVELVFPVLVALLLADIALAVLARVAPQFGIFSIGMQVKVTIALAGLIVTMPILMPHLHQLYSGVAAVSVAVLK
jgi:flagellar biosynthetic protein FliR